MRYFRLRKSRDTEFPTFEGRGLGARQAGRKILIQKKRNEKDRDVAERSRSRQREQTTSPLNLEADESVCVSANLARLSFFVLSKRQTNKQKCIEGRKSLWHDLADERFFSKSGLARVVAVMMRHATISSSILISHDAAV